MQKYNVQFSALIQKSFTVEAKDEEHAEEIAQKKWDNEFGYLYTDIQDVEVSDA